jgi:lysyl-tRNA synthetase class 1
MHWAEVEARKLIKRKEKKHVLATAITPSGPIHLGNMREMLTTEAIYRSLRKLAVPSELIFIADNWDPLRRVYPYLDKSYEKWVGMPLSEISCPCGKHSNYGEHWLEPFFKVIEKLGIEPIIYEVRELYQKGFYKEAIKTTIEKRNQIRTIIEKISQRKLPANWIPFNIKCEQCKRLTSTSIVEDDGQIKYPLLHYRCKCGFEGKADLRKPGAGKLPWRIEWPARWKLFRVTFEACGKDLAAAGGAWQTGEAIAKEVFNYPPPNNLTYEFIYLKGKGAMHSSTGIVILPTQVLKILTPAEFRFLFMKQHPHKHLEFDPSLGILDLVDEWDRWEQSFFGERAPRYDMKDLTEIYELSQPYKPAKAEPFNISYRHLVIVAQLAKDFDGVRPILERSGFLPLEIKEEELTVLKQRLQLVRDWIEKFAPPGIKFELQKDLPKIPLSSEEKIFLSELAEKLEEIKWSAEILHSAIYEVAKEVNIPPLIAFKAIYKVLLGREKGPRLGYFLASLERNFVIERFRAGSEIK